MTQLTLTPAARASHPATSHAAARSVDGLTEKRAAVLKVLREDGQCTHEYLVVRYCTRVLTHGDIPKQAHSGIRSRCAELVRMGLVEAVPGEFSITSSGRKCCVWRSVAKGAV